MEFWFSTKATNDVSNSVVEVERMFSATLNNQMAGCELLSPLKRIGIIPVIINPSKGKMRDFRHFSRKQGTEYVDINISHDQWVRGSRAERVDLYTLAIRQAIEGINDKRLSREDKDVILEIVENVRLELRLQPHAT